MAKPSGSPKGSAPKVAPAKRVITKRANTSAAANQTAPKSGFGPAERKKFLIHLAETANVSESCKQASVHSRQVYDLRKRSDDFRARWEAALAEGYTRIEAWLMEITLGMANGTPLRKKSAANLQAQRIALSLLSAHRSTVRGHVPNVSRRDSAQARKAAHVRVEQKLRAMRARLRGPEPSC
jgi:hypothetical protein